MAAEQQSTVRTIKAPPSIERMIAQLLTQQPCSGIILSHLAVYREALGLPDDCPIGVNVEVELKIGPLPPEPVEIATTLPEPAAAASNGQSHE